MRASISTCGCGRSSVLTSSAAGRSRSAGRGRSSVLVRVSTCTSPRADSALRVRIDDQVGRLRVAERHRQDAQLAGERLRVGQLAPLLFLLREHVNRRDAHDRAVDRVAELVGLEDDVERLIPRHVAQRRRRPCR